MFTLNELAGRLAARPLPFCQRLDPETQVTGIGIDSRRSRPGELFVALAGTRFDGHDFIDQAVSRGAAAVVFAAEKRSFSDLAQRYPGVFWLPVADTLVALGSLARAWLERVAPRVIAVTGSNGKSTTKEMLAHILAPHFRVHKTAGNYNNRIGLPLTLFAMPDDCEVVVLEMGMSAPGEIADLAALATPEIAILTGVAAAHLQGLGSLAAVAQAKCEIMTGLKNGGSLVYDVDDPWLNRLVPTLAAECSAAAFNLLPVSWHGATEAVVRVSEIWMTPTGFSFVLSQDGTQETVALPLWGRHNVKNAALAAAAALLLPGITPALVGESLQNFKNLSGRLQRYPLAGGGLLVHDAYNANPASLEAALTAVAERRGRRYLALVLGDMKELGPESAELHRQMGLRIAEIRPDLVVLLGEEVEGMAVSARNAGLSGDRIRNFPTGAQVEAFNFLRCRLPQAPLILVKGSRSLALEKLVEPLLEFFETV
ncbi:MAG: UDP-N-acetylmuramoyl-tripeptide--D-alanyl-D-alanine ligase [Deltaproteobacteria bacterium]|nr:UDP-N-acetylmuramoyl-tripeptide--D-alanyl-D-alanine ligase [Deltaproteobacteria bacterium]